MTALRLSDDQRRIVSFFVDFPPEDKLGLQSAVEYLKAISDNIALTLKAGAQWVVRDTQLVRKSAQALADKADTLIEVPKFWEQAQATLSKIHPDLRAR